jgi:hypothetical protein
MYTFVSIIEGLAIETLLPPETTAACTSAGETSKKSPVKPYNRNFLFIGI